MRILFFVVIFFSAAISAQAQDFELVQDSLNDLGKELITSRDAEVRKVAADAILPLLSKEMSTPEGFAFPFDSVTYISIQYPADRSFRIFTWQLYEDENHYAYFGAIQLADGQFIPLKETKNVSDPEFDKLDQDHWMGAVYYNIQEFKAKGGMKYLLFGFNAHSYFERQKIVDVLELKDGQATFGSPVFFKKDGKRAEKQRIVLTYSAAANVRCNFDEELNKIMYDHLIVGAGPDGRSTLLPDGSYEAYALKGGKWIYEEKVFHEVLETAPRPAPILDAPQKDIFGKSKGQ